MQAEAAKEDVQKPAKFKDPRLGDDDDDDYEYDENNMNMISNMLDNFEEIDPEE